MKTTLPFSTISFNSAPFLELKLNEHLKAHNISFWAYITHQPEEDERKEHHHVWIVPSKGILTDSLMDDFKEPDPNNSKPRACLPCSSSKIFADWYLYAIHDTNYLLIKGQTRKYHYRYDAIKTSDEDYLRELYKSIDITKLTPYEAIKQAVGNGLSFDEFVAQGQVPIPQFHQWQHAFDAVRRGLYSTFRNDSLNHEPDEGDVGGSQPPRSGEKGSSQ